MEFFLQNNNHQAVKKMEWVEVRLKMLFKNVFKIVYLTYMYKKDLALNEPTKVGMP